MYIVIGKFGSGWEVCHAGDSHVDASEFLHRRRPLYDDMKIIDCPAVEPLPTAETSQGPE